MPVPSSDPPSEFVTLALRANPVHLDDISPSIISELRVMARALVANEPPSATIQATALVNVVWKNLKEHDVDRFENRKHVVNAFRLAMKRLLIDRARRAKSPKHGGDRVRLDLDTAALDAIEVPISRHFSPEQYEHMYTALDKLRAQKREFAEALENKYILGMTDQENATALDLGEATIRRHVRFSLAWIRAEMGEGTGEPVDQGKE